MIPCRTHQTNGQYHVAFLSRHSFSLLGNRILATIPGKTKSHMGKIFRYPARMVPALACDKFLAASTRWTMTWKGRSGHVQEICHDSCREWIWWSKLEQNTERWTVDHSAWTLHRKNKLLVKCTVCKCKSWEEQAALVLVYKRFLHGVRKIALYVVEGIHCDMHGSNVVIWCSLSSCCFQHQCMPKSKSFHWQCL